MAGQFLAAMLAERGIGFHANQAVEWLNSRCPRAIEVVTAMATFFGTYASQGSEELDAAVIWLASIAKEAAGAGELDLLEACCGGAFEWIPLLDEGRGQAETFS
ncbi:MULTISPECIES: hypothetical protein [Streptomyces]|uniref:Uncharacterized protein n=1 Tax=Streptomyces galilaeus TaxID=33899 RepID=A0ABW9IUM0_STRGJ